ncbi:hypothetical protein [Arenibaculum pallidiluteum]|uniref:hypothetical protein n=1 Tax=Arenibaculum pallidiluteum TaxID=2812559 RepID=UPI001A95D55C|nr:hypothetical protein [Arenibaculum pallidiluteum]
MLGYILSLCAVGVIMLGAVLLPRWLGLGPELRRLRRRKVAIQKMQQGFAQRVAQRRRELIAAAGLANRMEQRRRELMHERVLVQGATVAAIRIIDVETPRRGAEVWMGKVVNRNPDAITPRPGGAFFFDRSWAAAQTVLVLASTPHEAREAVEKAFPDSLGFAVTAMDRAPRHLAMLVERPGTDRGPKAAA